MSDQMFDFDTSRERKQVDDFDKSLDKLLGTLNKLDRTGVDGLRRQLDELNRSESIVTKSFKDFANKMVREMDQLATLSSKKMKSFEDLGPIKALIKGIEKDAPMLKSIMATVLEEMKIQQYRNGAAMVANATETAKKMGAAFSSINTQVSRNSYDSANYKQFFADFSKGMQGSAGGMKGAAQASANVFMQAFAAEAVRSKPLFDVFFDKMQGTSGGMKGAAQASARVFADSFADEGRKYKTLFDGFSAGLQGNKGPITKAAKDSANVFMQAFATEAARSKQMFTNFDQMLGIGSKAKSARDSFSVFEAAGMTEKATGVNRLSSSLKQLTIDGNDAHSMARGLASGFNLLWLTWGNLVPLFAGAGISFGLKKTFDIGSEVEYMIKFMETLGQTVDHTGKKMEYASGIIRAELRAIDQTTMFSLTELSEAMVRLGQAGQSPAEALKTLRPAADLAAVGMTDLKTTTDLLIQTNALFNKSAGDSAKTAAQIFEVTKSGVLNVEDISGSMKYASEANTRFGKSLEETLALLGALAQAGLKGSSGGTALINFYRDLNGRSGPAIKAMKELERATGTQIEVFDKFGKQRSGIAIFNDIATAADKLKAKDADKILAKIFSDRGGRTFFAMVRDGTIDLEKMVQKLQDVKPESLFDAAQGMMDTTKGAVNILQGAFVGSLDQVFEAYSGKFKGFIKDITQVVDSGGFRLAVAGIIESVSGMYNAVKNNIGLITTFLGMWAGFKVISFGVAALQGVSLALARMAPTLAMTTGAYMQQTMAVTANSQALIANAAAARATAAGMTEQAAATAGAAAATRVAAVNAGAAGLAMRGLTGVMAFLANPLVGIGLTVAALATSFFAMKSSAEDGMGAVASAVVKNGVIIEAQLMKEIALARQRNTIVGAGDFSAQEATVDELAQRNKRRADQVSFLMDKAENPRFSDANRQDARRLAKIELDKLATDEAVLNRARDQLDQGKLDHEKRQEKQRLKMEDDAKKAALRAKAEADAAALSSGGGKGRGGKDAFQLARSNELSQLEKLQNQRLQSMQHAYDNEKKLTEAKYNAGILAEGEYQARSLIQTMDYEHRYIATIEANNTEYIDAFNKRYTEVEKLRAAASKAGDNSAVDRLDQELENLNNTKKTYVETNLEKISRMEGDAFLRMGMSAIKAEGDIIKLEKASTKYWDEAENAFQADLQQNNLNEMFQDTTSSILDMGAAYKAAMVTFAQETAKHGNLLTERRRQLKMAEDAYSAFVAEEADVDTILSSEYQKEILKLGDAVARLRKLLDMDVENADNLVNRAAANAFQAARNNQYKQFTDGLADAFSTAIFEGGAEGGKQLRSFLKRTLLQEPFTIILRGIMGSVMGSLLGGLGAMFGGMGGGEGGAGGGGFMSSLLGGVGSSIIGGGVGLAGMGQYFGTGLMNTIFGTGTSAGMAAGGAIGGANGAAMQMGAAAPWILGGLVIANILGLFRKTKKVGGGLTGTLGTDDSIRQYDLMRKSGTLLQGPDYSYRDAGKYEEGYKIQAAYKQMRKNVVDMAKTLGLDYKKVENFTTTLGTDTIHPDTGGTGIKLDGLSGNDIAAKIEEALATANNELAMQVIGTIETKTETTKKRIYVLERVGDVMEGVWKDVEETVTTTTYKASEYAKEGEKAIDTLTRLATSLVTVNAAFELLGYKLAEASLKGGDFASKIIEAFGSADAFNNATSFFFNNFYSDAERAEAKQRALNRQFKEQGLSVPKSEADYRKLVEAQDLTTESGRKMYAFLLTLAPLFKDVENSAKDIAKANLDKAADRLRKAFDVAMKALQKQIDDLQVIYDSLNGIVNLLKTNIAELYNEVAATQGINAAQGQNYIDSALAALLLNPKATPDQDKLATSISAVRTGFSNTTYTSQFEEDNARLVLAGKLSQMVDVLEPQLTTAEQQLKVLRDQYKAMETQLEYWENQLSLLEQGNQNTLDIGTAISEFTAAMAAYMEEKNPKNPDSSKPKEPQFVTGPGGGPTWGPGGAGSQKTIKPGIKSEKGNYYYETYLGSYGTVFHEADDKTQERLVSLEKPYQKMWADATASGNVADLYAAAKASGMTLLEVAALSGFYYEDVAKSSIESGVGLFANGGLHGGGLRVVGERGWELEATGPSRIWNQDQLSKALTGDDGSGYDLEILTELRMLNVSNQAIVLELAELRRIVTQWDADGLPTERVEA